MIPSTVQVSTATTSGRICHLSLRDKGYPRHDRCRPGPFALHVVSPSHPEPVDVGIVSRRTTLGLVPIVNLLLSHEAYAVQGITAGRIPGLSTTADDLGFYTYTRPEGKSGGHGVGWSEIPRYSFKVPSGWAETPVSIADLGGTEIDLRFAHPDQGSLMVIVAPVLRFMDVGFNANVRIDQIAPPGNIIAGFAPELYGGPLDEESVVRTEVKQKEGITYYEWELKPHTLVTATAMRNRLFLISIKATNSRQWRKIRDSLRIIQDSFSVPEEEVKAA